MNDPFDTLGVARRFTLPAPELAQRHRDLSRALHPDRYVNGTSSERRMALERASAVNDAYRVLRDPLARATVLLTLLGAPIGDNDRAPGALLMEIMDLREALDDARHKPEKIAALKLKVEGMVSNEERSVSEALDADSPMPDAVQRARSAVIALKYLRRFLEEADALET